MCDNNASHGFNLEQINAIINLIRLAAIVLTGCSNENFKQFTDQLEEITQFLEVEDELI